MKKIINLPFSRFLVTVSFVLFLFLFWSCKRAFSPDEKGANDKPEADKNYIHLQNQSDHSGVLIKLLDTDVMAVTDSLGYFVLPKVADGEYTLQAKYPFFKIVEQKVEIAGSMLETKVQLELEQQLQFWVEPAETTFSISEKTNFWKYKAYATNVSNNVYEGRSRSGTSEWGIVPENINWNLGVNGNINSKRCFQDFASIGLIDIPEGKYMYLQPGDTTYRRKKDICLLGFECTPPGRTYLLFYVFVDQMHFDEYFQHRFFVDGKTDNSQIYNPLTKSFFKKCEMFRPAIIHFTQ